MNKLILIYILISLISLVGIQAETYDNKLDNVTLIYRETTAFKSDITVYQVPKNYRCETVEMCLQNFAKINKVPIQNIMKEQMILARALTEKNITLGHFDGMSIKANKEKATIKYRYADSKQIINLSVRKSASDTKLVIHRRVRE